MVLNVFCVAAGALLIAGALNDVFQSAIVPRSVGRRYRISFYFWRELWQLWPKLAWKIHPVDEERREDFLAVFAPFTLTSLLFVWAVLLIFGYGLIFYGLRSGVAPHSDSLITAIYFGGESMTTIGFGDVVGTSWFPRILSVCAAITGLALFSITTAYLFALFGSFQSRETFVVTLGARAGSPPSGVSLLAIAAYSQTAGRLEDLMIDGQRWAASIMESHLAYPVLAYFRSSHDYQSWIGTLGTLLDAATIMMTTIDSPAGEARIFYNIGRHASLDLARYYRVDASYQSPAVERAEFESACNKLEAAGYKLRERDEAWRQFAELRSSYAPNLNAMARFFIIPPLQWIGDRSTIDPH